MFLNYTRNGIMRQSSRRNMFKVSDKNIRTIYELCSNLTIKKSERRYNISGLECLTCYNHEKFVIILT